MEGDANEVILINFLCDNKRHTLLFISKIGWIITKEHIIFYHKCSKKPMCSNPIECNNKHTLFGGEERSLMAEIYF